MDMRRVYSSTVNSIGYDAFSKELHVEFKNGKVAVYSDVPADTARMVTDAPSIGTALNSFIKGRFAFGYKGK